MAGSDPQTCAGSCLCGAVAFVAEGPFEEPCACHCRQCRTWSGHYWASTSVPLARFRLVRDDGLRWFAVSDRARRGFCGRCGASLFWKPEGEDRVAIALGSFDDAPPLRLVTHIFGAEAGDYYAPAGPPPKPDAAGGRLQCGCLCGGVRFDLPAPAGPVTACHCGQCRKLSGHYAASFDTEETGLHFRCRDRLAEYQTAGGGWRGFCTGCGSSLYFRAADGGFSVEAGAVQGRTGGWLAAHIFTAGRPRTYDIDDGLPQD